MAEQTQYISGLALVLATAGLLGALASSELVVKIKLAMEAAFCSAKRVTFAGSKAPLSSKTDHVLSLIMKQQLFGSHLVPPDRMF